MVRTTKAGLFVVVLAVIAGMFNMSQAFAQEAPPWEDDLRDEQEASDSAYLYDSVEGGLVDVETGLVWASEFGLEFLTTGLSTYDYANGVMPGLYMDSVYGGGYEDWRCPTKAELEDAISKDLYDQLLLTSIYADANTPYPNGYWSSDPPFRKKGMWSAYAYDLVDTEFGDAGPFITSTRSALRCILVRGVAAPKPPTKGKGK
jgi:hypothetical protein